MTHDDVYYSNDLWIIYSADDSFGYVFVWDDAYLDTYYEKCYEIEYDENFMIRCNECSGDYLITEVPEVWGYWMLIDG